MGSCLAGALNEKRVAMYAYMGLRFTAYIGLFGGYLGWNLRHSVRLVIVRAHITKVSSVFLVVKPNKIIFLI